MRVADVVAGSDAACPHARRECGRRPVELAPGQALARAVIAWSDEMLCPGVAGPDAAGTCGGGTRIHLLGGFLGTADIFDHLTDALGVDAASIATPARFR